MTALEDDAPERIDVTAFVGGLVDIAVILSGYAVCAGDDSTEINCDRCFQSLPIMDGSTALEVLNLILEHNETLHRGDPDTPTTG